MEEMKKLGVEIHYLRDPEKLYSKGETMFFDGFIVHDPNKPDASSEELAKEDKARIETKEKKIDDLIDRPLEQLDPIELSILMIGVHELETRIDIPYKVVINESVNLAKRFGALDGHKYINACLDVAAKSLREIEVGADAGG